MANLSISAHSQLTAIVCHEALDTEQLIERVPVAATDAEERDPAAWFESLQELLDEGLIVREAGPASYIYRPTRRGIEHVYGHLPLDRVGLA